MADMFSENNQEATPDLGFNDLVGEGRKYRDPDALAKAYAHVEGHARTLEAENNQLRAKADLLEANSSNTNARENTPNEPPAQSDPITPAPKQTPEGDVDFRSQIREEVKALNEQERAGSNLDLVATKMAEVFGSEDKASEAIRNRARELNVSVDWLKDSAARSPTAFFATMNLPQTGNSLSTPAPTPSLRMPGSGGNTRNFEHFDKMRKEDPKLYYSANTQAEMLREAKAQGADFYKP